MKLATHFSLLIAAFLFSYAYAVVPQDSGDDSFLSNKPDPVLTGVEPLCVVIISHGDEPNRNSGLLKNIKRKTEADLKKAGIEVIVVPDENNPPELPEPVESSTFTPTSFESEAKPVQAEKPSPGGM